MKVMPIPSVPGAYANDMGQVKFPTAKALMPHGGSRDYETKWVFGTLRSAAKTARHKYYGVLHRGRNYKIHRLICEAFHGPQPDGKPVVLHLDEDATNNKPENLRWGTMKENSNFPGYVAYCKSRVGENSPYIKGTRNKKSAQATIKNLGTPP